MVMVIVSNCLNVNVVMHVEQEFDLEDPELNELEECGGGYLSDDSDDDNCGFTIDGEGDKKIIS